MLSMYLPLASIVTSTLLIVLVFISAFLMLIILLQRGDGGGLSGAFGGMGSDSAFGVKGDKTFKKLTAFVATVFVLLVVVAGLLIQRDNRGATATTEEFLPINVTSADPTRALTLALVSSDATWIRAIDV